MSRHIQEVVQSFEALGLEVGASTEEAQAAYRKLIRIWHPDVFRGDPEKAEKKAKTINSAFTRIKSLTASDLRAARAFLRSSRKSKRPSPRRPFRSVFWRPAARRATRPSARPSARPSRSNRQGRDIVGSTALPLHGIVSGMRLRFVLPTCRACAGWGTALDEVLEICLDCGGLGWLGPSGQPVSVCSKCQGKGCHSEKDCATCRGTGKSTEYAVVCSLPPGIERSSFGVLRGFGHPGVGRARAGDLYLLINVP